MCVCVCVKCHLNLAPVNNEDVRSAAIVEKVEPKPTNEDSHQAASKISASANIQVSTRDETE